MTRWRGSAYGLAPDTYNNNPHGGADNMIRMRITQDHGEYRKGQTVTMDWLEALKASWAGWAERAHKPVEVETR